MGGIPTTAASSSSSFPTVSDTPVIVQKQRIRSISGQAARFTRQRPLSASLANNTAISDAVSYSSASFAIFTGDAAVGSGGVRSCRRRVPANSRAIWDGRRWLNSHVTTRTTTYAPEKRKNMRSIVSSCQLCNVNHQMVNTADKQRNLACDAGCLGLEPP